MNALLEEPIQNPFATGEGKQFGENPFMGGACCVLKKCCEKYKRKGKHCKKCPKG
ncbi:hypothetical protein [Tellurirhabdus rosea]|uniref:hypothetical protein n=1 Tax=Tellurirhabdus rosea TaxID=2674997 RepID=UPI002259A696|nr:hypothetical protein [Tellurirhabdus rosea]